MAINAYTGLMGSGKSYEVVENVILPAVLAGRRVVTNIAALQIDDVYAYLVERDGVKAESLGSIVQIVNEDVDKPDFFPVELVPGVAVVDSICRAGDLVVIDECWRWWGAGSKISAAHMNFFRMHRHFVDLKTSASCDLVLIVQDIGDLDRKLKVVVENTYKMTKHKALGASSRYRVDLYGGYKTTRAAYRSFQRKYDKAIFALYQSYSQGAGVAGKEVAIDDRANIFKGWAFRFGLPLSVLLLLVFVFFIWRFFHPVSKPLAGAPGVAVSGAVLPAAGASAVAAAVVVAPPALSSWRVVGHYEAGGFVYVFLSDGSSSRYLVNPRGWYMDTLRATGLVDGVLASGYSGAVADSSLIPGSKK